MTIANCLEKWPEDKGNDPRIRITPDVDGEIVEGALLWCIEICREFMCEPPRLFKNPEHPSWVAGLHDSQGFSRGLVLRKIGDQLYSRVGKLTVQQQKLHGWMFGDGTDRQNITII